MRIFVIVVLMLINVVNINGFNMECPFSSSVNAGFVPFKPGCVASSLSITSRDQKVTSVNSQIENNFAGSTLKHLFIGNQVVNFIPQKLGDFFKDLEGIKISNTKLKEVEKNDLAQFPKLIECSLDSNEIQVIPPGLFDGNLELVRVYFNYNKLIYVAPDVLTPLKKLREAHFMSNTCISANTHGQSSVSTIEVLFKKTCQGSFFAELWLKKAQNDKKMRAQTLQFDEMLRLKTELEEKLRAKTVQFDEMLRLKTELEETLRSKTDLDKNYHNLELKVLKITSCNQIVNALTNLLFAMTVNKTDKFSEVPRDDVNMKCKMNSSDKSCEASGFYVRFPDSYLVAIVDEDDKKIDQSLVEKLLIVDQQTLFLPKNLGSSFPNLKELTIVNSGYFHIDRDILTNMPKLTTLKINDNKIRELSERSQSDNDNLLELNFAFNQIETIDDGAFVNLGNLRVLNLTANLLTTIKAEIFSHLNSLRVLNLQQNKLTEISSTLFYGLSSLMHLDISNNKIEELPGDIIAPGNKISEFLAGSNKVKIIEPKLLKRLKKSQIIDLTQNICIDAAYYKNSDEGITLEAMHSKIFLECSDDDY